MVLRSPLPHRVEQCLRYLGALQDEAPSMTTSLEPITVYVEPEVKEGLAAWAKKERRSLSGLAGYLLTKAYQEYEQQKGA